MNLKRKQAGLYVTEDGRYEVSLGVIYEMCDNPHPDKSQKPFGYCDGGVDHAKDSWGVWDLEKDDYIDDGAMHFETKREAVEYLEEHLREDSTS